MQQDYFLALGSKISVFALDSDVVEIASKSRKSNPTIEQIKRRIKIKR